MLNNIQTIDSFKQFIVYFSHGSHTNAVSCRVDVVYSAYQLQLKWHLKKRSNVPQASRQAHTIYYASKVYFKTKQCILSIEPLKHWCQAKHSPARPAQTSLILNCKSLALVAKQPLLAVTGNNVSCVALRIKQTCSVHCKWNSCSNGHACAFGARFQYR